MKADVQELFFLCIIVLCLLQATNYLSVGWSKRPFILLFLASVAALARPIMLLKAWPYPIWTFIEWLINQMIIYQLVETVDLFLRYISNPIQRKEIEQHGKSEGS